jgi:hypothetical protein
MTDERSPAVDLSWYQDVRRMPPIRSSTDRRAIRRRRTLDALACLALAALCFSQASSETLLRMGWDFYSRTPLGPPTLQALFLNIVALAAAGYLGVLVIRRTQRAAWRRPAAVAAATALLVSLNYARITYETLGRWTDVGRSGLLALVVLALVASLVWPRPALQAIRCVALAASPLAVITLMLAAWMFFETAAGPVWRRVAPRPLERAAPSLRRVVWLVFDELDQRLAFEARPAGLQLPELDRLRRESLYTDAARPPAGVTEVSMPALITGRPVVAVAPTSPNDLELTVARDKTARWSAAPNVFSRARTLGYDTALIGWRLPYPRVLGESLGMADFRASVADEQARGTTLGEALRNQWGSLVPARHARALHARRTGELGHLALRTATDGRFGLVLIHLPLPDSPGGYRDDLVAIDGLIGDLRRGLERARLDEGTWLILSGARWWHQAKDADGGVDHRVPFLIRPPGGGRAVHVDAPFTTLVTHDLVVATLRGSIRDTDAAAAWLTSQRTASPKAYTPDGRPVY